MKAKGISSAGDCKLCIPRSQKVKKSDRMAKREDQIYGIYSAKWLISRLANLKSNAINIVVY